MSLTVRHLNGDTTFLLTFAPLEQQLPSPPISGCYHAPGTFTVLLDPWLAGSSSMWHPKFLLSRHTTPSCIDDLSQIPEPNVVLISQVKPDHCHEATLRQLDPTSPITTILAEPAAAKKIRSMKHFNPAMVHSLRPYSGRKADSVIRFCIPATVPNGIPGEATISFMPAKLDVAGVHNAIGITYRPPQLHHQFNLGRSLHQCRIVLRLGPAMTAIRRPIYPSLRLIRPWAYPRPTLAPLSTHLHDQATPSPPHNIPTPPPRSHPSHPRPLKLDIQSGKLYP